MIEIIIIILLVLISLYLAFNPYNATCKFIKLLFSNCFPHWIYIGASIIFFAIAVILYNNNYSLQLRIYE